MSPAMSSPATGSRAKGVLVAVISLLIRPLAPVPERVKTAAPVPRQTSLLMCRSSQTTRDAVQSWAMANTCFLPAGRQGRRGRCRARTVPAQEGTLREFSKAITTRSPCRRPSWPMAEAIAVAALVTSARYGRNQEQISYAWNPGRTCRRRTANGTISPWTRGNS